MEINKTGYGYTRGRNTHGGSIYMEDGYIWRRETDLHQGGSHMGERYCNDPGLIRRQSRGDRRDQEGSPTS